MLLIRNSDEHSYHIFLESPVNPEAMGIREAYMASLKMHQVRYDKNIEIYY
jgi:hypothetical protein